MSEAFPRSNGSPGMSYRQWLIGQVVQGGWNDHLQTIAHDLYAREQLSNMPAGVSFEIPRDLPRTFVARAYVYLADAILAAEQEE